MKEYPKVLVISHNPFSKIQNNGKTLKAFFKNWPKTKLAQLFLVPDNADIDICSHYYRITDINVLNNLLKKESIGEKIDKNNVTTIKNNEYYVKKSKFMAIVRNMFLNGSSFAIFARCIVWKMVRPWKSKGLNNWISELKPDLIFFQSSNTPVIYDMVNYIVDKYQLPIIVETTDDYVTPHFSLNPFYLINVYSLRKKYHNLVTKAHCVYAIGEMMANEYQTRFGGNFKIAMNSIDLKNKVSDYEIKNNHNFILTYAGNLELNRWLVITKIATAIDLINRENNYKIKFNIYSSSELNKKMKHEFSKCKCLSFNGCVDSDKLNQIRLNSDFLIHVESFDKKNVYTTRLSLSTKIPEYLLSKRCVIAIGPSNIASIKYIKNNQIGYVISNNNVNAIKEKLILLFNNNKLILKYLINSEKVALKNHQLDNLVENIQTEIRKSVKK